MSANGRTVVEISIRQSFLPTFPALDAQRFERYAAPCLAALKADRVVLLADSERLDEFFGPADRERGRDPRLAAVTLDRILAMPLDDKGLVALDQGYRKEAQQFGGQIRAEAAIAETRSQTASAVTSKANRGRPLDREAAFSPCSPAAWSAAQRRNGSAGPGRVFSMGSARTTQPRRPRRAEIAWTLGVLAFAAVFMASDIASRPLVLSDESRSSNEPGDEPEGLQPRHRLGFQPDVWNAEPAAGDLADHGLDPPL